jgi:hypothetical protein
MHVRQWHTLLVLQRQLNRSTSCSQRVALKSEIWYLSLAAHEARGQDQWCARPVTCGSGGKRSASASGPSVLVQLALKLTQRATMLRPQTEADAFGSSVFAVPGTPWHETCNMACRALTVCCCCWFRSQGCVLLARHLDAESLLLEALAPDSAQITMHCRCCCCRRSLLQGRALLLLKSA